MRCNNEHEQTGYFAAFAICMSSVMGIAMASNLLTFFFFYELLTIASYPLVLHKRNEEALLASRKYLIYTLISGQLFLAGLVAVYCISGTMDFKAGGFLTTDMAPTWQLQLIFLIMILAGSVKAAVMPLHGWLPAAMIAPTPVSALLHAVAVVKTGVFAVLRIIGFVFGPKLLADIGTADILAWFAAGSIIISSLIAIQQDNLKRRLAFSTIAVISVRCTVSAKRCRSRCAALRSPRWVLPGCRFWSALSVSGTWRWALCSPASPYMLQY